MPIEVELYNGNIVEFPDNTDKSVIASTVKSLTQKSKLQGSPDKATFGEAIKAGIENIGGAGVALKAGFMDLIGNDEGETQATEAFEANKLRVGKLLEGATDWRDIANADSIGEGFGRTLDFVKEQFGLNSPQMVVIMSGGFGGSALVPLLPHPLATLVGKAGGFTIGATAAALPMFTGWNVGRQLDEGLDPDIVKAGKMAVPQALTEALIGRVFSSTGLGTVGKAIFGRSSEKVVGRVGQKIGEALAVGVPAEIIQQGFERASADLKVNPFESEEAATEYIDTAFATIAGLAPLGSVALLPSGDTKAVSKEEKEKLEAILKEDIISAIEPKSNAIKNTKEATSALKSLGINPDIFTPEAMIKAANIMIDRIDENRMKFMEMNTPKGVPLVQFMTENQATPQPYNPESLKNSLRNGTAILSRVIEQAPLPNLAQAVKPKFTRDADIPVGTVLPDGPSFDTEASVELVIEKARVAAQRRQNASTAKFDPNTPPPTPTQGDTPGAIIADLNKMSQSLKEVAKQNKADLIETAKGAPFNIPESDLKDPKTGQLLTKEVILQKIVAKRAEQWEPFQVPVVTPEKLTSAPLGRVTPEGIAGIITGVEAFRPKPEVVPKFKPVLDQFSRVAKEVKSKLDFGKALAIDTVTGRFKTPLKAAQAANFVFTAANFNNIQGYKNLDVHLMEVFENYLDTLTKDVVSAFDVDVDTTLGKVADAEGIHINVLKEWNKTLLGRRELYSYLFSEYAQGIRMGKPTSLVLPPELKKHFDILVKQIKKSKEASTGLGVSTFEDVFPLVSVEGMTPREAMFDSVQRLREERLKALSEHLQYQHWAVLDEANIKDAMNEAIKGTPASESLKKTGLWARTGSLYTHLASHNAVASVGYNLRRAQEDLQSKYLNLFSDSGNAFFSSRSKEIRTKAADIIDHLRTTDQKLERGADGSITFIRGSNVVSIKNSQMIEVIEGLDKWSKTILGVAELNVYKSIDKVLPGTLMKSPLDIHKAISNAREAKSLSESDYSFLEDQLGVLENLKTLKTKPFVPKMRFGTHGFTVHLKANLTKDKNGNLQVKKGSVPVYHTQVESGRFEGKYNKTQYEKTQSDLKRYKDSPDLFHVFDGFEITYDNMYSKVQKDSLTLELLAGLLGSDKSEESFVGLKDRMERKVKYRGFQKRFGESENIAGYSTDWDRVISAYNTGAAHFFAKSEFAPLIMDFSDRVQAELGSNHDWLKKKVRDYAEYTTSPNDSWQSVRTMNYLWTMGGNVSSALLQVMTLPTTNLGSMTQFDSNLYKNAKIISKYSRMAFKEFPNVESSLFTDGVMIFKLDDKNLQNIFRRKYKMSEAQISANINLFREGRSGAVMLQEQTGIKNSETRGHSGKLKEKLGVFANFLGIPISAMEQATRFVTFNSHYELFNSNPETVKRALRVLKNDHRWQMQLKTAPKDRSLITNLALFGMDEAHAVFGKDGRGDLQKGPLGAFVFPFSTYPQNAIEFLSRLYGRGPEGKKALAVTLGTFFLFAGLLGLPGGELLKELLEEAYKAIEGEDVDLEKEIRIKISEITGEPRAGMFLTQGLFRSVLNLDVSRRIGLPIVGQDLLLAMMGVRGDMTDILGVQGSILSNGVEAWNAYNKDENGTKVAALLSPVAISNLLKAYNYSEEGVRTAKGIQLMSQENMGTPEILLRAMGFTTGQVASAREEQYWKQSENMRIRPKMERFRAKGKNLATRMVRAERKGNADEAEKYRKEYQDLTQDVMNYLAKANPQYDMGAFHRSVIDAVDQSVSGGVRLKDLNKENRGDLKSINRASGKDLFTTKKE